MCRFSKNEWSKITALLGLTLALIYLGGLGLYTISDRPLHEAFWEARISFVLSCTLLYYATCTTCHTSFPDLHIQAFLISVSRLESLSRGQRISLFSVCVLTEGKTLCRLLLGQGLTGSFPKRQ